MDTLPGEDGEILIPNVCAAPLLDGWSAPPVPPAGAPRRRYPATPPGEGGWTGMFPAPPLLLLLLTPLAAFVPLGERAWSASGCWCGLAPAFSSICGLNGPGF